MDASDAAAAFTSMLHAIDATDWTSCVTRRAARANSSAGMSAKATSPANFKVQPHSLLLRAERRIFDYPPGCDETSACDGEGRPRADVPA
jgi:hypothetical protein